MNNVIFAPKDRIAKISHDSYKNRYIEKLRDIRYYKITQMLLFLITYKIF